MQHPEQMTDEDLDESLCYRCIGVTTQKKEINISATATPWTANIYWIEDGHYSFFDGTCNLKWRFEETVIMILNCDEWTVTYYLDNKQVQKDKIEPNKCYFFAILCCADIGNTHMQIVDTSDEIL